MSSARTTRPAHRSAATGASATRLSPRYAVVACTVLARIAVATAPVPSVWSSSQQPRPISVSLGRSIARLPLAAIGRVDGAAVDRHGDVFLLDGQNSLLRGFGPTGQMLATVGGPGLGRGALAVPRAIALGARGNVLVYDARTLRISRYIARGGQLHFAERVPAPPVAASDMCVMEGDTYIFGYYKGKIVHRLSADGRAVTSFGSGYGPPSALAQYTLAAGHILCDARLRRVVVASRIYPEVRSYSSSGVLLWSLRFPLIKPTVIRYLPGGGVGFEQPYGGSDMIVSLAMLSDRIGAIQVGRVRRGSIGDSVHTYYVSLVDGGKLGGQTNLPLLFAAYPPLMLVRDPVPPAALAVRRFAIRYR